MSHSHSQSGFSLVETLVAITILLLVIVGPMTIISTTANSTSFASEQVVAFFLAQEGVELAQKARDDIVLNRFLDSSDGSYDSNPWATFSDESSAGPYEDCFDSRGCALEVSEDADGAIEAPVQCTTNNNPCRLYYDDTTGSIRSRYTHSATGNTLTEYTRSVYFENISAYEIRVVSEVEWFTGSVRNSQQVEVETYLYDVYGI